MLFQGGHVARVFHLTVELLPSVRLIGPLERVTVAVDFVLVRRDLLVDDNVFGAEHTAVETAVPLQHDAVVANVQGRYVFGMVRRPFGLQPDGGPDAAQSVGHATAVIAVIGFPQVGHLQHAGVNVAAAFVDGRVYLVVAVTARQQRGHVIVVTPLELRSGIRLYPADHFGRFVQIAGHFVELVQHNRFVCKTIIFLKLIKKKKIIKTSRNLL